MCEHGFRALPIFVVVENPSRRRPLEAASGFEPLHRGKSRKIKQ
jgi:hypothetical protein